jgi:DASS family divalent anion:Na+ symporter
MLAALALGIAVYTRKGEAAVISRDELTQRLQTLGRLTMAEWAALAGLAAFIVGATTASMTGFQLPWIALAILYVLLTLGFLSQREIKERIDWPFLIYLAGTIGLVRSFDALGLGEVVSSGFTWLGALMRHDFPLFVLALFAVVSASRLLLPKEATAVIAATVLMPLGAANGIDPWVIGFLLLLFGATWFFGYQSHIAVRFMEEANHEGTVVSNSAMLRFNLLLAAIRLLAVFCSIPYWKSMGLL